MERLARLREALPRDDEVALFYALSLYANSDHGKDVKRAMEAAAIAQDVFERNPDHPGAAHYLIHACDSPEHAVLALRAAQRYAQIAPAASHALHMPSHIFVQLGMWREVASSNTAAFAASAKRKRDWHSFTWLAAARLELGQPEKVLEMADAPESPHWVPALLRAMWIEATGSWSRIDEVLGPPGDDDLSAARVRLDAAGLSGDESGAERWGAELTRAGDHHFFEHAKETVAARIAQARSVRDTFRIAEAIDAMRALADLEDAGPQGPAFFTPAREELGDLFTRSHRFVEAEREFLTALERRPNRRNALRGLSEAARGANALRTAGGTQPPLSAQGHH